MNKKQFVIGLVLFCFGLFLLSLAIGMPFTEFIITTATTIWKALKIGVPLLVTTLGAIVMITAIGYTADKLTEDKK